MNELFFENEPTLMRLFIYHCQHSIYVDDAITQTICMFLEKPISLTIGLHGVSFFNNSVIFPYYHLTEPQRRYLYDFVSKISCDRVPKGFYRLSNGCITMNSENGKKIGNRLVWRVVFNCIKQSDKHVSVHRMLASVTLQRVLCRINMHKTERDFVNDLIEETFPPNEIVVCKPSPGFLESVA